MGDEGVRQLISGDLFLNHSDRQRADMDKGNHTDELDDKIRLKIPAEVYSDGEIHKNICDRMTEDKR